MQGTGYLYKKHDAFFRFFRVSQALLSVLFWKCLAVVVSLQEKNGSV